MTDSYGTRFGPKVKDHPSIGKPCPICEVKFKEGDYTWLTPIGPADDEQAIKMLKGKAYTTQSKEICESCFRRMLRNWMPLRNFPTGIKETNKRGLS